MNSIALQQPVASAAKPGQLPLIALLLGLTALADFLLYDQPTGLGYALLAASLAVAVFYRTGAANSWRIIAACIAIAPLLENVSGLSLAVSAAGLAAIALSASKRLGGSFGHRFFQVIAFGLILPFRMVADLWLIRKIRSRLRAAPGYGRLLVWVIPSIFGLVFLLLFAAANPIFSDLLSKLDLMLILGHLSFRRIAFWLAASAGIWAYLRPRLVSGHKKQNARQLDPVESEQATPSPVMALIFGRAALLRSLVLFNALFAIQTLLDLIYLWGGVELPDHLTYAGYAHRGAYPLIVTALLAAGFVLAALRPGGAREEDRTIRWLVYLWIGQNVLLVISSILRLDLYVGVYALTYWRIAAFLWMGLVGIGLVLIIARIKLRRSGKWLTNANLVALSTLAYACCFINFAGIIADWNVSHSREVTGHGINLDLGHLSELGAQAAPALINLQKPGTGACFDATGQLVDPLTRQQSAESSGIHRSCNDSIFRNPWITQMAVTLFQRDMSNWRAWTFRNLRLQRTLATLQK